MKLRRSLLWTNVLDMEKLHMGIASDVDAIVLDLEDTVPEEQKRWARDQSVEVLVTLDFGHKERIVRVNNLWGPYGMDDLHAVLPTRPDAIRLPKCETVDYILEADRIITVFEREQGLRENCIELILMIETPLGILNCYTLASCCPRITAIGIGTEDLTTELGIERRYTLDATELLYAKQKLIMDGRAAGVQIIDACVLFKDNDELLYNDSLNSRAMGFDGRSVMDLGHIGPINRAFSPTERQITWAKGIIHHYERMCADASVDPYLDGVLVDVPVVAKANRVLESARRSVG